MARSLAATCEGLDRLRGSLYESGFAEAVDPYRRMRQVLLQQREWALAHDCRDLDPYWQSLGATARAIRGVLSEFSAALDGLDRIDRAGGDGS
ncbi:MULTISPECIES: hypothetical protein [unclassified Streptomyces]|uniref:hypothetical protein n=1 Tax=unclassified Streptomyces TaxID=2593676 RepID=UPI0011613E04|nr:hypothetical protein [Streptomyces sp. TSRI0107]